jgi:hypothetical protein
MAVIESRAESERVDKSFNIKGLKVYKKTPARDRRE